jgi:spore coat polysaccharide biosynthesis predicted glycosyltransferase SpsG
VMARRILVVIEPDTSENWTLRSLEVLENLNRSKIVVDCAIGSQHPHASSLNQFKLDSKLNLRIHQNVDRLDALMPRADLAIVSRNTVMELAHQGVPSLVVPSTGQNKWMEKMHESGAIVLLDSEQQTLLEPPKSPTEHLRIVLKKLLDDPKTRKQMSETARQIVDGRGSIRVAKKMAAAVTHSLKKSA